jgi:hypothetical protein
MEKEATVGPLTVSIQKAQLKADKATSIPQSSKQETKNEVENLNLVKVTHFKTLTQKHNRSVLDLDEYDATVV